VDGLENGGEAGFFLMPAAAFDAGAGGGEVFEAFVTGWAVDPRVEMRTIPEATATFADFQIDAQFHDFLSRKVSTPAARKKAERSAG